MSEDELLIRKMLEEAIEIIMDEWGYNREEVIQWLNRRVEGDD